MSSIFYGTNGNFCYSHAWIDTGMLKTWCKYCGAEGRWCRQKGKYVQEWEAKDEVNDKEDREKD